MVKILSNFIKSKVLGQFSTFDALMTLDYLPHISDSIRNDPKKRKTSMSQ